MEVKKGNAPDGLQTADSVFGRARDALNEQFRSHLLAQSQEFSEKLVTSKALGLEDEIHVGVDRLGHGAQPLFLLLGRLLAIPGLMRRSGKSLRAEAFVMEAIGGQRIFDQTLSGLVDLQALAVLQNLHRAPLSSRDPKKITAQSHIAVLVDKSIEHSVGGGKMSRKRSQKTLFILEGFGGDEARLGLGTVFHAIGGPLQSLLVEVLQVLEGATW